MAKKSTITWSFVIASLIPCISMADDSRRDYGEYRELTSDFPYYPEEFEDFGPVRPFDKVHENLKEQGIVPGDFVLSDFVVGGINLATHRMQHPPFLLYEDFDIGSYVRDQPDLMTWKEMLRIRQGLERPSLSWYVDKVARKRFFKELGGIPQPEFYYLKYKHELSETGTREDETETILANLPTRHGFCAKPTHMSMTLGNWLVDIEPGSGNDASYTTAAKRLTSNPNGNAYDPRKCADSLAEGLRRESVYLESWALRNVKPGIVVEELFSNHEDRSLPPHEFCMFVVWGKFYVAQHNFVGDDRYLAGFFYRDKSPAPGCPRDTLPDWVPWDELVEIAERLSQHKDMFRVDVFVGVPRYSEEGAPIQISVSESEIHPTTMFCNPLIAEEMARLWIAGYKIGNYKTVPNNEVPNDYVRTLYGETAETSGNEPSNNDDDPQRYDL